MNEKRLLFLEPKDMSRSELLDYCAMLKDEVQILKRALFQQVHYGEVILPKARHRICGACGTVTRTEFPCRKCNPDWWKERRVWLQARDSGGGRTGPGFHKRCRDKREAASLEGTDDEKDSCSELVFPVHESYDPLSADSVCTAKAG